MTHERKSVFSAVTGHHETTSSGLIKYFWDNSKVFRQKFCALLAEKLRGPNYYGTPVDGETTIELEINCGEQGRADVVIRAAGAPVVVIENKIWQAFRPGQVLGYAKKLREEGNLEVIPVMLFPEYRMKEYKGVCKDEVKVEVVMLLWSEIETRVLTCVETEDSEPQIGVLAKEFRLLVGEKCDYHWGDISDMDTWQPSTNDHKCWQLMVGIRSIVTQVENVTPTRIRPGSNRTGQWVGFYVTVDNPGEANMPSTNKISRDWIGLFRGKDEKSTYLAVHHPGEKKLGDTSHLTERKTNPWGGILYDVNPVEIHRWSEDRSGGKALDFFSALLSNQP